MDTNNLSPEAAEAVHKAKNAAQAIEFAREAQARDAAELAAKAAANLATQKIADKIIEKQEMREMMHEAVMKGFSFEDTDERRRFIDVTKEKLICQSIVNISDRLQAIEGNLTWGVRIVIGAFIVALTALVMK